MLTAEQIERYKRHIVLPQIGVSGQGRLLNAVVFIISRSIKESQSLIYYLAASGIGNIYCDFEDKSGFKELLEDVLDLNPDVKIRNILSEDFLSKIDVAEQNRFIRIILGDKSFLSKYMEDSLAFDITFPVTILGLYGAWDGIVKMIKDARVNSLHNNISTDSRTFLKDSYVGNALSLCFIGPLIACLVIDVVIGNKELRDCCIPFDLLNMEFGYGHKSDATNFKSEKKQEIHSKLSDKKVLIIGAGGLGSPAAIALTMAGIGTLGIVDSDHVEISNLNRQVLHTTSRLNLPKANSAKIFLNKINPSIRIIPYNLRVNRKNIRDVLKNFDVVIGAVDNLATRYLVNDACHFMKKPYLEAGIQGFYGIATSFIDTEGPCYRCIFPENTNTSQTQPATKGVLGPVPGVMGFIEAAECIKTLTNIGTPLQNRLVIFDASEMTFNSATYKKSSCLICGK